MKIALILIFTFSSWSFEINDPDFEIYSQGYNAIVAENWQEAIAIFEQLHTNHPESRWADNASFWKCYADRQIEPEDERDFECFDRVVSEYSDSRWADEAREKQRQLAERLAGQGRDEYAAILDELEESDDQGYVSLEALAALERRGGFESPSNLVEVYERDTSILVKRRILELLAEQEDASDKLYQLLLTEHNPVLYRQGIQMITGSYEPQFAWGFLHNLYEDRSEDLFRIWVLKAMSEISDQVEIGEDLLQQLREVMEGSHGRKAQLATDIVTGEGTLEGDQLKEIITNREVHPQTRITALESLRENDPNRLPDLFDILMEQRNMHIFSNYLEILLNEKLIEPEEILENILQHDGGRHIAMSAFVNSHAEHPALSDKWKTLSLKGEYGENVAMAAVLGIKKTGSVDDLLVVIKKADSPLARRQALSYVRSERDAELEVQDIIEIFEQQDNVSIKAETLNLFEQDERDGVIPFLIEVAKDSDHPHVRRQAVAVIGTIDTAEATQALLDLM